MRTLHNEFKKNSLNIEDLNPNPLLQFSQWLGEYSQMDVSEGVAMSLSTIDRDGFPSSRIIYLRNFDENGFVFFTNYNSNKGKEIRKNNKTCLLFYWPELERQIRIWGKVVKVNEDVSDAYFKDRPKGSQASAWVSNQSEVIKERTKLEKMHQEFLNKSADKIIPRPKFWGGYSLVPERFEFWQGRENRLHDRFLYSLFQENWEIKRLAP